MGFWKWIFAGVLSFIAGAASEIAGIGLKNYEKWEIRAGFTILIAFSCLMFGALLNGNMIWGSLVVVPALFMFLYSYYLRTER